MSVVRQERVAQDQQQSPPHEESGVKKNVYVKLTIESVIRVLVSQSVIVTRMAGILRITVTLQRVLRRSASSDGCARTRLMLL